MEALEFLDLEDCTTLDDFWREMAFGTCASPPIFPNLKAISLSATINKEDYDPLDIELILAALKSFLEPRLGDAEQAEGSSAALSQSPLPASVGHEQADETSSSSALTKQPALAQLRWLNLDNCDGIDDTWVSRLEDKIETVIHRTAVPEKDFVRGMDAWEARTISVI